MTMTTELVVRETLMTETDTALMLPDGLSIEEWESVGEQLGRAHRASGWWIGDWINYGEKRWGQKYEEAQAITGLSYSHLSHCARVASRFQFGDRSPKLTWSHYNRAKALPNAEQVLERAAAENWTVRDLQREARKAPPVARVSSQKRHQVAVESAAAFVKVAEVWNAEMCVSLTPPQARKQLTVLNKAAALLAEVIAAVEYRAATPHSFMGR